MFSSYIKEKRAKLMPVIKAFIARMPNVAQDMIASVKASPLGYRLAHGAFWSLAGSASARFLNLVSFVIVARIIGKEGYGEFGVIQSTIGMFGVFAGFGLGQTATKYLAELKNTEPERAGRIMGMAGIVAVVAGTLMAFGLFFFAPWLATNTLANSSLTPLLRISSIIIIFEAMNGAQLGALVGFEAFKKIAAVNIWVGLASLPCMLTGVYLAGLEGSIWGLAANRFINWLLSHIALRREARRVGVPFTLMGSKKEVAVLWHYSLPSMIAGIMFSPTIWLCNTMLVNQPDGYDQMGIFQAANSFRILLFFIGDRVGAPLLPMMANMIGMGKHNERLARINILSTWFLGTVPAVFLVALPEIAQSVYGQQYAGQEFINTFMFTVFCASIVVYKQGLARVLAAHGLMWWGTFSNIVWAIAMITCSWFLVPHGAWGYSIAWVVAYSLNTAIFIPLYTRRNLVPKGTIISWEAGVIWLSLIIGMSLTFLQVAIVWRLVAIPAILAIMCWMFWRLFTQRG